jgi:hypothetical protein
VNFLAAIFEQDVAKARRNARGRFESAVGRNDVERRPTDIDPGVFACRNMAVLRARIRCAERDHEAHPDRCPESTFHHGRLISRSSASALSCY